MSWIMNNLLRKKYIKKPSSTLPFKLCDKKELIDSFLSVVGGRVRFPAFLVTFLNESQDLIQGNYLQLVMSFLSINRGGRAV